MVKTVAAQPPPASPTAYQIAPRDPMFELLDGRTCPAPVALPPATRTSRLSLNWLFVNSIDEPAVIGKQQAPSGGEADAAPALWRRPHAKGPRQGSRPQTDRVTT